MFRAGVVFRAGGMVFREVLYYILYIYYYIILLYIYYILYYTLLLFLPSTFSFLILPSPSSLSNIHSIRVGIWIHLFISHPIFKSDPAQTNGGECRVVQFDKYVFVFEVLSWCDVFDVRCILYLILLYLIYYTCTTIIYYTIIYYILYSSLLLHLPIFNSHPIFLSSSHHPSFPEYVSAFGYPYLYSLPLLPIFSPFSLPPLPSPSSSFILYVSGLPYPYLYSISIQSFPSDNLTPHVLSEWMVEV